MLAIVLGSSRRPRQSRATVDVLAQPFSEKVCDVCRGNGSCGSTAVVLPVYNICTNTHWAKVNAERGSEGIVLITELS